MAKKGFHGMLPPTDPPEENIEAWLNYFAQYKGRFRRWTDPFSKKVQIIIRRSDKELGGGGKHLLGSLTRAGIIDVFLKKYGTIDAVNSAIKSRE
ncbi:MAG: hypothetical protein AB1510_12455 [Bacillota bacterium]